jgi:hypothetical protein
LFSKKLFFKKKVFGKQYLLVIAKLNDLNKDYKKTVKCKNISIDKIFPNLVKQIMSYNNINQNIFIWGAATKSLMFLIYLKKINPFIFKNVKFAVDIDKKKHNKFLQIVDVKIVSPEKLLRFMKNGDTIIVANSNYLNEVQKYVKKFKFKKINYRCID